MKQINQPNQTNIKDLKVLSDLMDTRFQGPMGYRFGLDGLVGLIPVMGDVVTNSVSVYILVRAGQLGCPPSVLLRMGLNVLVENVVDIIPLVGNLFDFVWKANTKNIRLIESYLANPRPVTMGSRIYVGLTVAVLLLFILGTLIFGIYCLSLFINYLSTIT